MSVSRDAVINLIINRENVEATLDSIRTSIEGARNIFQELRGQITGTVSDLQSFSTSFATRITEMRGLMTRSGEVSAIMRGTMRDPVDIAETEVPPRGAVATEDPEGRRVAPTEAELRGVTDSVRELGDRLSSSTDNLTGAVDRIPGTVTII
jgi:ABC-type transporter Mla subunit MlaD